jgi:hypothetical protein
LRVPAGSPEMIVKWTDCKGDGGGGTRRTNLAGDAYLNDKQATPSATETRKIAAMALNVAEDIRPPFAE